MGSSPSFPLPEDGTHIGTQPYPAEDYSSAVTGTIPSTDGKANSATVVVFGIPEAELEAVDTNQDAEAQMHNDNVQRYLQSAYKPDSPFVSKSDGDLKKRGKPTSPLSMFPGNFGGGGGGGGDIQPDEVADTFKLEHIGGLQEQKEYLQRSIILPFVRPDILQDWGVSPPKGILLHGPPGTGKTFMAKALVNELKRELGTNVNFFYRKGGDVFSMWFGESQRKLRQVFETAKRMSPSVLFFDEIDGLCPSRDGSHNHGTEAYSSVVTCFLGQMDGLENGKVFVIAATNRLEAVDPAVRRPGRFDKHLAFGFPDEVARRKIIEIHTSKWNKADQPSQATVDRLAQITLGYSGADLEKLCKDVVYSAIEANGGVISDTLKITENHWRHAMGGMQRTAADSFGSSLYMPTRPNLIVSKLIEPIVEAVIEKMRPMLSESSLNLDPSMFHYLRKSFLVQITPNQSKSFLNNQILQGILSSPLFNKMSLFEISSAHVTNKVLSGAKPTILAAILDVIHQAEEAQQTENCAVVVIPNINELLEIAHANLISQKLVLKALAKIQGPKMFLFATSSIPLDNTQDCRVIEMFIDRYMQLENPRTPDLQQFFDYVLTPRKHAYPSKTTLLNNVVTSAARLTDNHAFEHVLNLASALLDVNFEKWQSDNALNQEFSNVFEKYQTSKLR